MKEFLLTLLRNKETSSPEFRAVTERLALLLAMAAAEYLPTEKIEVETPLAVTEGVRIKHPIVLIPILRAGLALLYPFMRFFPECKVGFIGMRRDEVTAEPHTYYQNIPPIKAYEKVMILEPMIATGGSSTTAITILKQHGVVEDQIIVLSILGAPEGITRINKQFSRVVLHVLQTDAELNHKKFIIPGLGDFGDRYFGTVSGLERG